MSKKIDTLLAEAIAEKGLIAKKDLDLLLKEAENSGETLQQVLLRRRAMPEKELLGLLASKLNVSLIDLKKISVEKSVIEKIPIKIATYYKFLPLKLEGRALTIAVTGPMDIKVQDEIGTQLGFDIQPVFAEERDVQEALKKYYGLAADTLDKIAADTVSRIELHSQEGREAVEDIEKLAEDASVVKLVNQIILEGWKKRATDIHIEPYRSDVTIRYRIDGLLYDANVGPEVKNFLSSIISRIKIMSNLNIVERRLPQDGRAIVRVQEQVLDLRISTIPTAFGESMVIRILPTQMLFSLERLGLSSGNLALLETLVLKPHGIIFVTGPTGSGKTTSLYACLSRINSRERKIVTIEDPIEYEMSGITQIQVMPAIGLDFARGLRSILRHDPDVIMVGEVRDLETAETAIRVALTGHLVFSTLHTNDAASGITRLIDIGVEPYLVSSSVEAFIAQRLIRVICPECKVEDEKVPSELKDMIAKDLSVKPKDIKIKRGKGCPACNFTGFLGRTAIYEVIVIDDALKDMIVKKTASGNIKKAAVAAGMRTLRQDGWQKVLLGVTTPEEVMKVTSAEEEAKPQGSVPVLPAPQAQEGSREARVFSRLNSRVNVRYKAVKSKEDLARQGFSPEHLSVTGNISAGGLLLVSDEPLAIDSILELSLDLPDAGETIECLAKIVRIEQTPQRRYNIAICFLDITGAQRTRLNKYVEGGGL